ncbi:acylphosphatase, partial [Aliarcobacter butzleri]|uniref:acylphosphatase n=1 Tax=Aliarcobacter butzleri TaxID=28197 RepID=UPI003AF627A5
VKKGWDKNDEKGEEIEPYTTQEKIENFINEIKSNPPVLAKITNIKIKKNNQIKEYKNFEIIQSTSTKNKTTNISPD